MKKIKRFIVALIGLLFMMTSVSLSLGVLSFCASYIISMIFGFSTCNFGLTTFTASIIILLSIGNLIIYWLFVLNKRNIFEDWLNRN